MASRKSPPHEQQRTPRVTGIVLTGIKQLLCTVYSPLSYLARLPVQVLKVDVTLIAGMSQDSGIMTLVKTMISLALAGADRRCRRRETDEQATALKRLGCDELQAISSASP